MKKAAQKYGVLLTTTSGMEDARNIARTLLAAKLAACVQIVPIESFYSWKGEMRNEPEHLLLIKTRAVLFDEAIAAIKAVHPYTVPEIVGTAFTAGFAGYFSWIDEVTK